MFTSFGLAAGYKRLFIEAFGAPAEVFFRIVKLRIDAFAKKPTDEDGFVDYQVLYQLAPVLFAKR